jgi:hypothetical protein
MACPSSMEGSASCCGSTSITGYLAALAVGLLAGFGSVALDRTLRKG